jgi:hypothetical protein
VPPGADSPAKAMPAATSIDPQRMWTITSAVLRSLFGQYLNRR